jgi:CHAD domain-containing protein
VGSALPEAARLTLGRHARRLARRLGVIRDADVFLRHLGVQRPGGNQALAGALCHARGSVRALRMEAFPRLLGRVGKFLEAGLKGLLEAEGSGSPCRPAEGPPEPETARALASLVADLLAEERTVLDRRDFEAAHRMRIAAKRLRYSLELLQGSLAVALRRPVSAALRTAAELQGLLGHVHDHHVWRQQLRQMRRGLRASAGSTGLIEGFSELARAERRRRDRGFEAFLTCWEQCARARVFAKLTAALQALEGPAGRPDRRPAAATSRRAPGVSGRSRRS